MLERPGADTPEPGCLGETKPMTTKTRDREERTDAPTAMALEANDDTKKRARWENFAFVLPAPGTVNVANHSYGDEEAGNHIYTVTVDAAGPITCTCPAFQYHCQPGEACKHMQAVLQTEPVLLAALRSVTDEHDNDDDDEPELVTDGGQLLDEHGDVNSDTEGRPSDCTCLDSFEGLACFRCFAAGYETPNPNPNPDDADADEGDGEDGR